MSDFKVSENKPVSFDVKKGERYAFCTCGYSSKMPLCDGAHRENSPDKRSYKFEADKDQTLWLSQCVNEDDPRRIHKKPKTD